MEFSIEKIGPEKAKQYLSTMGANRPVKMDRVREYAADMSSGRWAVTPQGIIISCGKLVDGQHRLLAVVKSGIFVEMMIFRTEQDVSDYIDNGIQRSASDVLAIKGVKHARKAASITGKIMLWKAGYQSVMGSGASDRHKGGFSRKILEDFYFENAQMIDKCSGYAAHLYKQSSSRILAPSEIGFLYWLFGMAELAERFLSAVYLSIGIEARSPELALRKILDDRKASTRVLSPADVLQYCIIAFEKSKNGEKCEFIRLPKK